MIDKSYFLKALSDEMKILGSVFANPELLKGTMYE